MLRSLIAAFRLRRARGAFLPITRAVTRGNLTYLSPAKLARLESALRRTAHLDGDVVEFGVALGGSAIILAKTSSKRFFGLDVFGMIPPPTSEKDDDHSRKRFEEIKAGRSRGIAGDDYYGYRSDLYSDVVKAFERHGLVVDMERINLVRGLFENTWATLPIDAVALAHIDCDWYEPVRFCLESVAERLSPGGLIVIDDYHDYGGCKIAVDEFLESRRDYSLEAGPNPFIVRR